MNITTLQQPFHTCQEQIVAFQDLLKQLFNTSLGYYTEQEKILASQDTLKRLFHMSIGFCTHQEQASITMVLLKQIHSFIYKIKTLN